MIQLPGLIDVHTHLRVPGGEHKEDFLTGTSAALAGGVTMVLAMPNTNPPLAAPEVFRETIAAARRQIVCDLALYAGASPPLLDRLPELAPFAPALKIYLNDTFGSLRVDELPDLVACFQKWPKERPIALHAEKQSVAVAIALADIYERPVHIVHVSRREEIELIAAARRRGLPVTCEVTPHHLLMTRADAGRLGPLADMRPVLGSPDDVAALWEHLGDTIDCIATDHAPHTLDEKRSANPPPGIIGLETALPLMWTAVSQGRLSRERLVDLMHTNPKKIFGLPDQPDTWIDFDPDHTWTIQNKHIQSKCGWTPFDGWEVTGRVVQVTMRGRTVFADGRITAEPGSGRVFGVAGDPAPAP